MGHDKKICQSVLLSTALLTAGVLNAAAAARADAPRRFIAQFREPCKAKTVKAISNALELKRVRTLSKEQCVFLLEERSPKMRFNIDNAADHGLDGLLSIEPDVEFALNSAKESAEILAAPSEAQPPAANRSAVAGTPKKALIAVLDSGISASIIKANDDYRAGRSTIQPNVKIWTNPGEIAANGLDDDRNGYIDDVHGVNTYTSNSLLKTNVTDNSGHGTKSAILVDSQVDIGMNTGAGFMATTAEILPIKIAQPAVNADLTASTSAVIAALNYAVRQNQRAVATGTAPVQTVVLPAGRGNVAILASPSVQSLATAADRAGINVVVAAGEQALNLDSPTLVGTKAANDKIFTVTGTTSSGTLSSQANYGQSTVDIGGEDVVISPGDGTVIILPPSESAATQLAAIVAQLSAQFPRFSPNAIKETVEAVAYFLAHLQGLTQTPGKISPQVQQAAANTLLKVKSLYGGDLPPGAAVTEGQAVWEPNAGPLLPGQLPTYYRTLRLQVTFDPSHPSTFVPVEDLYFWGISGGEGLKLRNMKTETYHSSGARALNGMGSVQGETRVLRKLSQMTPWGSVKAETERNTTINGRLLNQTVVHLNDSGGQVEGVKYDDAGRITEARELFFNGAKTFSSRIIYQLTATGTFTKITQQFNPPISISDTTYYGYSYSPERLWTTYYPASEQQQAINYVPPYVVAPNMQTGYPTDTALEIKEVVGSHYGVEKLAYASYILNSSLSYANGFIAGYYPGNKRIVMATDNGSVTLNCYAKQAVQLENSSAVLDCAGTTADFTGGFLTITWKVRFKSPFIGDKYRWARAKDAYTYTPWVKSPLTVVHAPF